MSEYNWNSYFSKILHVPKLSTYIREKDLQKMQQTNKKYALMSKKMRAHFLIYFKSLRKTDHRLSIQQVLAYICWNIVSWIR